MYPVAKLSNLIGQIYEGASDPVSFQAALRSFMGLSEAHFVFFAVIDGATKSVPQSKTVGPDTSKFGDAMQLHQDQLLAIDPGLPYALSKPEGGVFKLQDTSLDLTSEPEAWRDFIRHDCGSSDYHSRFSAEKNNISVALAMHTNSNAPTISSEQENLHSLVFDHFERAVRLAYRPPIIAELHTATILVDARRNIVEMNKGAEAILSSSDSLLARGGKLYASHQPTDKYLATAFRSACAPMLHAKVPQDIAVESRDHSPPLLLSFQPIPLRTLGLDNPSFLCRVEVRGGQAHSGLATETLQLVFGLTPREADVASLLATQHRDLPATASALGMGYETARSHLRSVYAKCGVSNQVELVRLLARYE